MIPKWLQVVENWFIDLFMRVKLDNMEPETPQATQSTPIAALVTPIVQSSTSSSTFEQFCGFIKTYEGANPVNNNPYDFKYFSGGYLPKYGVVKESSGGFAIFETLALGEEYGQTCITEMIQNHPTWNFLDFFAVFAPSDDNNNPVLYATTVAKWMNVPPTTILSTFLFG